MSTVFRALTESERNALERILSIKFRDLQQLRMQVNNLGLRPINELLFEFASLPVLTGSSEKRTRTFGVPVECTYIDKDGAVVYVDLFINDNDELVELEIWKPDGSVVQTYFAEAVLAIKPQAI
jgi:hypothetical protein